MLEVGGVIVLAILTLVGYYRCPLALLYIFHVGYTLADLDYTLITPYLISN